MFHVDNPVYLAPMAGITDVVFRRICKEMGCGRVYTEMVSASGLYYDSNKTHDILYIHEDEKPVAVQIFGSKPDLMGEIANKISNMDGVLLIDINMGCPAPKIVKNGEGSALMLNTKLVAEIVKSVVKYSSVPVTVKMRKGWDENNINVLEIAKICEDNGAAAVTIHGRTKKQMYSGEADWDIIKKVKESLSIPVIGNGDIFEPQDAKKMLDYTGCDAVMIGRGAQGNPWIFKRTLHYMRTGEILPGPTPSEKIDMAIRHMEGLVEHKGEYVGVREARKHTVAYLKGIRGSTILKNEVNKEDSPEKVKELLNNFKINGGF